MDKCAPEDPHEGAADKLSKKPAGASKGDKGSLNVKKQKSEAKNKKDDFKNSSQLLKNQLLEYEEDENDKEFIRQ